MASSSNRVSGLIGAGIALGTTELMAGVFQRVPSLNDAVGQTVIDWSPQPVVKFGIRVFGTYDKVALAVGIVIVSLLLGGLLGSATAKRRMVAPLAFAAFGLVGVGAATRDPGLEGGFAIPSAIAAVLAGTAAIWWLLNAAGHTAPDHADADADADADAAMAGTVGVASSDRRRFVLGASAGLAAAIVAPALGRRLAQRFNVEAARAEIALPAATPAGATTATTVPVATDPAATIEGLSTLYTPNNNFYLIDTAFTKPQIDPANWSLKIDGAVDTPLEFTFDELLSMATTEADVTLSCVSNQVGGGLVGNARWLGVPLTDLLDRAGVQPEGNQIYSRSVDGWTCGFPTALAYDGRTTLVAIGMNGEPLPVAHGFPARLVVAGLYGYVSATKWLDTITLTDWDSVDGYWIPRGWSKQGPIKTQSRIDTATQRQGSDTVTIAGVAWAPTRGITKVELSVDGGPWVETELGPVLSEESWRQWWFDWTGPEGEHTVAVRATDGTGAVQTDERRPPAPDGATGHDSETFRFTV